MIILSVESVIILPEFFVGFCSLDFRLVTWNSSRHKESTAPFFDVHFWHLDFETQMQRVYKCGSYHVQVCSNIAWPISPQPEYIRVKERAQSHFAGGPVLTVCTWSKCWSAVFQVHIWTTPVIILQFAQLTWAKQKTIYRFYRQVLKSTSIF